MKQELLNKDLIEEDVVEEFARQLEEVVHIEDEDNDSFFGYQQLPQDEEDGWEPLESDNEEEEETQGPLNIRLDSSQKIDAETSDLIKAIMSKIEISNVPEWAKSIPESSWMPNVQNH
ncbi:hypothetical protein G6F55_000774 [Rhizopus delemar]|uniref:Uncharacterized protein n=2 Tax=Rhizopus TaxID=4842 RepID=A0A9P6ZF16_9FUNG|nr:hypothetical protein G6F55_000774 [Rhizopus delemar]KAG1553425.1 hypothetical protein G6F51_000611 [Rhizopus arrhizus]KAG1497483.1 hypothetical protein G6F54_005728 [Rhizopus delemar]KAG1518594.1 hypothetical protein G6F53_000468 [Rhizopus delemar]KAG1527342.1 hypothetical protein G6F52_001617 [Rhizopus delemar]